MKYVQSILNMSQHLSFLMLLPKVLASRYRERRVSTNNAPSFQFN